MKSEANLKYQIIDLPENLPFRINTIMSGRAEEPHDKDESVMDHWHPEMEIVYTIRGHAIHYIDGQKHVSSKGSLFIVNSESIHKVLPDKRDAAKCFGPTPVAIVLLIDRQFIERFVPARKNLYFFSEISSLNPEREETIGRLMTELGRHPSDNRENDSTYIAMHLMSLIYELLYQICLSRVVPKDRVLPINSEKNLERLRGIIEYVAEHYSEDLSQAGVADRFYFSKEYFARFFRKNTGLTFMEYVTRYRLGAARTQLINSDVTVTDIALCCGFSDARGLINSFKKYYGTTPFQYRKKNRN